MERRKVGRSLYWIVLGLSITYCLAAGVLALWTPKEDGIDFSVCYVAGATAVRGSSPYNRGELTKTRSELGGTVGTKPSYPFAYPPSVIPACVLLSRLPWAGAQALWKLLNTTFLIGAVLFTFWIFSGLQFTTDEKYIAWSFAFIFSPTVSVLLVGQSSLLVLFTALLTMVLYHRRKTWSAGLSLALTLTKPHLTLPLVFLLLFRRQFQITIIGLSTFAALGILGLHIGHSTVDTYLQGLGSYASSNRPTNPRLVGIQNLVTIMFGAPASVATLVSVVSGLLFLGLTLQIDKKLPLRHRSEDALPLLLLVSVIAFGAHSYDLVLLIPLLIWSLGRAKDDKRFVTIVILCFVLIVPLGAVKYVYERALSSFIPLPVYRIIIEPFRSWILFVLLALVMYLVSLAFISRKVESA
jgi:hypothetical protein